MGAAEDRPLVDALARHIAPLRVLDLCGQTRLPQLAALSLEADLMISNDTGPLHLAAAAGARVLGIYTCTEPEASRARSVHGSPRCKATSGVRRASARAAIASNAWPN